MLFNSLHVTQKFLCGALGACKSASTVSAAKWYQAGVSAGADAGAGAGAGGEPAGAAEAVHPPPRRRRAAPPHQPAVVAAPTHARCALGPPGELCMAAIITCIEIAGQVSGKLRGGGGKGRTLGHQAANLNIVPPAWIND